MKQLLIIGLCLFTLGVNGFASKSTVRKVKRNYPVVYNAIVDGTNRKFTQIDIDKKEEIDLQCKAFWSIAQELKQEPNEKRLHAIKVALLRWHWHWNSEIVTFPYPVDWHLAWKECGK
ncbi:hypothetical protein EMN47_16955 [Prolixibacteraceae bacterium JC049]|nr:hypothetical protein [Prolixibacteraceae bacterium JC049]